MFEKCVLNILELNWNQRLGHKRTKLNICHHMLTSSTQLQNKSFHVVEKTRTSSKCQKRKNARAKRAKILFFIVKYANLWGFCCRRRRGCLSSLFFSKWPLTFACGRLSEKNPFVLWFSSQVPVRVFSIVIWLTNKVFTRRPTPKRTQATDHESREGTWPARD